MAGFDYGRMQGVATKLLTRFNQGAITLTKLATITPGANPWDPPLVTDPLEYTLEATANGVSREFIDGTTIVASDVEITAGVFGAEPDLADTVLIDGKTVTLLKVVRMPAAGIVTAWKLLVRA
jgi:hypothetical protein